MVSSDAAPGAVREIRVWDLPLRLFHWSLVAAVALAFLSSEKDSALNHWHILAGWLAAILIVFRIFWGFAGGQHSRFSSFVRPSAIAGHVRDLRHGRAEPSLGHNPLGAVSVLMLLGLVGATVFTGAVLMEELHELVGWTLLALVVLHVAAVLLMSMLSGDNLIRAMVTGRKSALDHPGVGDAGPPSAIAVVAALLVCAAAAFGIQRYDPQAFSLRGSESYEHGSGAARSGERRRDRD